MIWLLYSFVGVVVLFLAYLVYHRAPPCPEGVPQIPSLPVFGAVFSIPRNSNENFFEWYVRNLKEYGHVWALSYIGNPSSAVVTTDPEIVEHILKTNFDNYIKGEKLRARLQDLLGNGIFNTDGAEWYQLRKVASHIFSVNNFKQNMMVVFKKHSQTLMKIMDGIKPGEVVDLQNLFFRFTLASFCEIAFGMDIGAMERDVPFGQAFDSAQATCSSRFLTPFWQYIELIAPYGIRQRSLIKMINEFSLEVIRVRREQIKLDPTSCNDKDLLGLFMAVKDEQGKPLSDTYLRDVVLNFVLAGRDTTAGTLSWTMFELSKHKDIEARIVAELQERIGARESTYEDMMHLPYTQAVLSETLRLHPAVPIDLKVAVNDDVLPGGIKIKGNTVVTYAIYAMNRDPSRWEDPLRFDPERFVKRPATSMSQFEFPVFNAGPRTCLGISMAHLEMKAVLAEILPRYNIDVVPGASDIPRWPALTLVFKDGLPVTISRK